MMKARKDRISAEADGQRDTKIACTRR